MGIDHELWARATRVLGKCRTVVLFVCPRCGRPSLAWSGMVDAPCQCVNPKCELRYERFRELIEGRELELAAQHEREIRELMSHDSYERRGGAIRQVRHGA